MLSCKDLKTRRLETSETGARPGNFRFFSNVRNKISKTRSWRTRSEDEFENFSEKKPVFVKWHAPGERGRALTRVPLWAEAPPSKTHIPTRIPVLRSAAHSRLFQQLLWLIRVDAQQFSALVGTIAQQILQPVGVVAQQL